MSKILFYDTETTGLPAWGKPSGEDCQPHIVQLGALLIDSEGRKALSGIDLIVKPDGWEIPEEVAKVHGITTEKALLSGVPEHLAFELLYALFEQSDIRVAHNKSFDQRIIRIASMRHGTDEQVEKWADKLAHECTMQLAKPIMKMPFKDKKGIKPPKLEEAYKFFTGQDLQNAHSAMADTMACMDIYFAIKDLPDNVVNLK
jgi:DNA polymerase III subunit epsilon